MLAEWISEPFSSLGLSSWEKSSRDGECPWSLCLHPSISPYAWFLTPFNWLGTKETDVFNTFYFGFFTSDKRFFFFYFEIHSWLWCPHDSVSFLLEVGRVSPAHQVISRQAVGSGGSVSAGGGLGLQDKASGFRTYCLSITDTRGSWGPEWGLFRSPGGPWGPSISNHGRQAGSWDSREEGGQHWVRHREDIWSTNWGGESLESAEKKLLQEQVWQGRGAFPPSPTPE